MFFSKTECHLNPNSIDYYIQDIQKKRMTFNLPSHWVPSPRVSVKPGLQVQSKLPAVLVHTASILQLSEPLSHSFISKISMLN